MINIFFKIKIKFCQDALRLIKQYNKDLEDSEKKVRKKQFIKYY